MSETKHSETPWAVDEFIIKGIDGKQIAIADAFVGDDPTKQHIELDDANAAYIVHCVNSYDSHTALIKELKEALEACKRSFESNRTGGYRMSYKNEEAHEEGSPYIKVTSALSSVNKIQL
jgi:hypothetical protein